MPGRPRGTHVCVVGLGVAGRLHHRLLTGLGATVSVVDPAADPRLLPFPVAARVEDVPELPPVDVWSVCTPTAAHVPTVAAVLDRDPGARLLVEKPVCRSWEGPRLAALLAAHEGARLVVMNQYAHAEAPALLRAVKDEYAPRHPVEAIRVAFGKDRRQDIAAGRFVDHDYGVFGYEWLHMLALLGRFLPEDAYHRYLVRHPDHGSVRIARDPELTSTAAHDVVDLDGTEIDLYSSVVGHDPGPEAPAPHWTVRTTPAADSRHRLARVEAGPVRLTLELDPVVLPDGTPLPRNTHRLTLDRPEGRREWRIEDSPLENALRHSLTALLDDSARPCPDLRPIARIGRLAALARHPADAATAALPTRL